MAECATCNGSGEVWTGDRETFGAYVTAPCPTCADEHPTTIRRSRSCGDFLADLRGMGEQRRESAA